MSQCSSTTQRAQDLGSTIERVDIEEVAQEANVSIQRIDPTPTFSSHAASPPPQLVMIHAPIWNIGPSSLGVEVRGLMTTLLNHIHPWMQKSIVEVMERIEKCVVMQVEKKI